MIKLACASAVVLAGLAVSAPSYAAVITFEDRVDGDIVTNQYPGVEFSSVPGQQMLVTAQPGIGFGNNFICTGAGTINCTADVNLTFGRPVNDLSFFAVGANQPNSTNVVALVDVFTNGVFNTTLDILGSASFNVPSLVDLALFGNVTSIRIHDVTDGGGLGWDNFTFVSAVPVPAALPLLASGLLGLGAFARRRKSATRSA